MREQEYRAWDEEEKRMEYSPGVKRLEDWLSPDINGLIKHCREDLKLILMQYTGLEDKNGKKIYEGDIVYIAGYGNCVIEFPFIQLYTSSWENDVEFIIGNIYENPELLSK